MVTLYLTVKSMYLSHFHLRSTFPLEQQKSHDQGSEASRQAREETQGSARRLSGESPWRRIA